MDEEEIFRAVHKKEDPAERAVYLDEVCGGDRRLRSAVEALLTANDEAGVLDTPPICLDATVLQAPLMEQPGTVIGRYKLLELIGEGGFGAVYMAEHEAPVRCQVALKVIKLGMDTKQVIARFEAERQALAMMGHPNIAKVLDAGATNTGRPYFVMELVRGVPITQHCDENNLTTNERLQLFLGVCRAIQHAHLKGIIHRDIKPTNVMVTQIDGEPVPKVIDFGIAKATQKRLTEKTSLTGDGQFLGTPQYMSPEQAGMSDLDVDIRTDVYSLGVLLYELLVGSTPFDPELLRQAGHDDMCRIIRETDPPTPSNQLSTLVAATTEVFKHRRTQPAALRKQLRGDLDCIVMKTLEKDRDDRYATAQALSDDLRRYLEQLPIRARRPTLLERIIKKSRRHRAAVAFAGVLLAVITLGSIVSTALLWAERRETNRALATAEEERGRAKQMAEEASAVTRFLVEDLLGSAAPERAKGRKVTVDEILANAEAKVKTAFEDQPQGEAALQTALARIFSKLGRYPDARSHAERARELRTALHGVEHVATLDATNDLAIVLSRQGKSEEARKLNEQVLAVQQRTLGPEHPSTLNTMNCLGSNLQTLGDLDEARKLHEQVLEARRRILGADHEATIASITNLAIVLWKQRKLDEAGKLFEESLEAHQRIHGPDHPATCKAMQNLAVFLTGQNQLDRARTLLEQVIDVQLRIFGPDHPDTLPPKLNVVNLLRLEGKLEEAQTLCESVLEACRRTLGPNHPATLDTMHALVILLYEQGKFEEASKLQEQRVDEIWRRLGPCHFATFVEMGDLIKCRMMQEGTKEIPGFSAEKDSIERAKEISPNIFFLATAHWQLGDKEEAVRWYDKAVTWMDKHKPNDKDLARFRDEAANMIGSESEDKSEKDQGD